MLKSLNKLGELFGLTDQSDYSITDKAVSIELACCVLLCEVMRADHEFDDNEQQAMFQLLEEHFNLTKEETDEVIKLGLDESEHANDLYRFTQTINQTFEVAEKQQLMVMLWKLANADGDIAAVESHIIRKIADLLHLRHHEYIATKDQFQNS